MTLLSATRRQVSRRFADHGKFSRSFDRLNRLPLLRDYVSRFPDVPEFATREDMWRHLSQRFDGAIDYLEFGVHLGHSILFWAKENQALGSRFIGFDTFEGLPDNWNKFYPKGHFDVGGAAPPTSDPRVSFVTGLFQETLPGFLATYRQAAPLVVHIDCDIYSSTLYCLTKLDTLLSSGTLVIFDEFGDVQHEFRAFNDYTASYRRDARLVCTHDNSFTAAVEMV